MNAMTLTEGLVAVPPVMLAQIVRHLRRDLLWWATDRLRKSPSPTHAAALRALCDEFEITVPETPFAPSQELTAYRVAIDTSGMGPTYSGLKPAEESIRLAIYWTDKKNLRGYWNQDAKVIALFPMSVDFIRSYPLRSHPQDIEYALNEITSTLVHELRHMVQTEIIQHPDQQKMKADYRAYADDYHTSPIEFDPTIGSCVEEFLQEWDIANEGSSKPSLSLSVKKYCGMTRKTMFGSFQPSEFFLALKKHAPQRYRDAVKKFTVELNRRLGVGPA